MSLHQARPHSFLQRAIGVKPSGPDGTWTRKDHLRAAGFNALWAAACTAALWPEGHRNTPGILGIVVLVAFPFAVGALVLRLVAAATNWKRFGQGKSFSLRR